MNSRKIVVSPLALLIWRRIGLGILTLVLLSAMVFLATEVLPGDAARASLGRGANEATLQALRERLDLNAPIPLQYWNWLIALFRGDFGSSLVNGLSVSEFVGPFILNSIILMCVSAVVSVPLAIGTGILAAGRRGGFVDNALSALSSVLAALPEFVVGIGLIVVFATVVFQWFPAVSMMPPGQGVLTRPVILILPVLTLSIVTFPYIFRMMRATMIEVLDSEYMEMAALKGLSRSRLILVHALPNAIAPTIQVIALTFAYLAGGTVMIEFVFGYGGVGQGLMNAIAARDIPVIQSIVLLLAAFYVVINIAADVAAILATPKLRVSAWQPA